MTSFDKYNLVEYVDQIRPTLKPPVSNKLMYSGEQLKVMIVAGPNERNDFHVELGEELFYMLIGDMDLDIMENGKRTRIHIAEGEFFLLPPCVPHSPQRYADTIGIVFERERLAHELDGLRWYVPGTTTGEILYEEVFHCTDLGTQIKEVIERFNNSTQSLPPPPGALSSSSSSSSSSAAACFPVDTTRSSSEYLHISLASTLDRKDSEILINVPTELLHGEFTLHVLKGDDDDLEVNVLMPCDMGGEAFLWQLTGSCDISRGKEGVKETLQQGEVTMVSKRGKSLPTIPINNDNIATTSDHTNDHISDKTNGKMDMNISIRQLVAGGMTLCVTNGTIPPL